MQALPVCKEQKLSVVLTTFECQQNSVLRAKQSFADTPTSVRTPNNSKIVWKNRAYAISHYKHFGLMQ